jgi:nicotinate-nucleotide adenylyltransferase
LSGGSREFTSIRDAFVETWRQVSGGAFGEMDPARLRIGVLGGTFDPIHHGHLIAAAELRHALRLDRVLLVPNASPPHKPGVPVSPAAERLAMLELAIQGTTWLGIDRIELERGGSSYTVDTLEALTRSTPHASFVFLMGKDSLRDLPTWRDPGRIVELAEIGVASRPDVAVDLDAIYPLIPNARGRVTVVEIPEVSIASRDLRRRVAEGRPITFQVPAAVERFIQERRLYRP